MALPPTNFLVLKGPGGQPSVGDVFEAYLAAHRILGRVVATDAIPIEGFPSKYLMLYVFRPIPKDWTLEDRSALKVDRLLLPPLMTDSTPFRRKYFRKVGNVDFEEYERLNPTTFRRTPGRGQGIWVDEYRQEVAEPTEPHGSAGAMPYLMIDDLASDALGVPRAVVASNAIIWDEEGSESLVRINCEAVPTLSAIRALGHEPNGYFWSSLLGFAHPDLMANIESDPEAGSVSFYGTDEATKRLRPAVVSLVEDPKEIARLVEEAKTKGVDLDD